MGSAMQTVYYMIITFFVTCSDLLKLLQFSACAKRPSGNQPASTMTAMSGMHIGLPMTKI